MYLSTMAPERREKVISNTRLQRYTANTIMSHSALAADLAATSARGYALDNEEYIQGMVALAVPIKDIKGRLYATLSFHAPCMRLPFSAVSDFLPQLLAASEQLSELLIE